MIYMETIHYNILYDAIMPSNISILCLAPDKHILIQSQGAYLDAIRDLFGLAELPVVVPEDQIGEFIAPYTNFITTDSTTLIEIINKCRLVEGTDSRLIRLESITLITPDENKNSPNYDKLTHRIYRGINEYRQIAMNQSTDSMADFALLQPETIATTYGLHVGGACKYTKFEIEDWVQCNSEHSRHWFFRTPIPHYSGKSLFDLVKSTLYGNPRALSNSLIAFSDNSSAIKSSVHDDPSGYLARTNNGERQWGLLNRSAMNPCLTAETHNFPTYYHPFEGANTGIGGRIRDSLATGCGSLSSGSWAGYSMSNLEMAKLASDGTSNYANKVGEPLMGGYLRWHPKFAKPILYTAGIGWISNDHLLTSETRVQPGDLIIKVGPQAFKIGLGGSLMSSIDNRADSTADALTAVQRGDPYEGNKVIRFCEYLATHITPAGHPLIHKIHDQGAGGLGNVVKELVEPYSARIDLSRLPHAPGMTTLECWLSEYQEQMVFTAPESSLPELERLARREGCILYVLGSILHDIPCSDSHNNEQCIHLTGVTGPGESYDFYYRRFAELPEMASRFNPILAIYQGPDHNNPLLASTEPWLDPNPEHNPQTDLKLWLTTKIDRSVGGCVIQQSHVGPYGLPMSDYGILAANPDGSGGWQVSALGENIWIGQTPREFTAKCIAELVGNLAGSGISELAHVKLSANWMWYIKSSEYCDLMVQCVDCLVKGLMELDMAIDGGKDSLSMSIDMPDGQRVISPPTLVLAGYASLPSWTPRVTPVLSHTPDTEYYLWALDLMALLLSTNDTLDKKQVLHTLFACVREGWVLAMHDGDTIQDTIEEMCLVSLHGFELDCEFELEHRLNKLTNPACKQHWLVWQAAEPVLANRIHKVGKVIPFGRDTMGLPCRDLFRNRMTTTMSVMPHVNWSEYLAYKPWTYTWSHEVMARLPSAEQASGIGKGRKVGIIRDMGSNSHREMAAVFIALGCTVMDFTINDLVTSAADCAGLLECDGIVFVGGFAYGDVLGSGTATAKVIRSSQPLHTTIQNVARDPTKFILGVCNGAQIILALDLLPGKPKLVTNDSARFESWFLPVDTLDGQQLGIWCAHGEGKFVFPAEGLCNEKGDSLELVGKYTSPEYPACPNGSQYQAIGIRTARTAQTANIIAIMPHPERSVYKHQCEYIPPEFMSESSHSPFTPWINFFIGLVN